MSEGMQVADLRWLTLGECLQSIRTLEARVGKSAAQLRHHRETWDMTVEERNVLDAIGDYEFLVGGAR